VASKLAHDAHGRRVVIDESGLRFVVRGNTCRAAGVEIYTLEDEAAAARRTREQLRQARDERLAQARRTESLPERAERSLPEPDAVTAGNA